MTDTLVKRRKVCSKGLERKILHERAKVFKRVYNMVINKLKKYQKKFHVKGEIIPAPHNSFTILHETGFDVLKVALEPIDGIPEKFSVYYQPGGKEYTSDLKGNSLDLAFEKLLPMQR